MGVPADPVWTPYPSALEFGESYLCADAEGRIYREMLNAGDARHSRRWAEVAWTMPASSIPRPPARSQEPTT